ncbi:ABC transporter substrate-binding protein [Paenibacillus mesophilus]|uniref:ABC transporter substrate-binding protein n=1 Tax=Paenibacillus mesophilus TaxID=2582849 RepID=UPI0013053DCE|nr:extracellular solute-binding protein [Paenibacillus mesophilus]
MAMKRMAALSLLLFATACSSGNDGKASEQPAGDNKAPPKVSTEPVTIKFALSMGWLGPDEFKNYVEEPVKKRFPYITIEPIDLSKPDNSFDKLMASGVIPDLVMTASPIIYRFVGTGMEDNIEPLIKKFNFDLSRLNPVAVESVKSASRQNNLIGLPWTMHFSGLYYNKDIFDKFGVPYPKDGMTWEDARELAKKVSRSDGGGQYRGLEPDKSTRVASVLSYGFIDPVTEKPTVNNDNWKKIFELLKSIYDIPGNSTPRYAGSGFDQFKKERTLAMLASNNNLPNLKDTQDLNWDLAQYPSFKERPNTGMQVDEWILHVTAQSKYKDQAFQVISTILSDEVQTEIARNARLPVLKANNIEQEFGKNLAYLQGKNVKAAFKTNAAKALPVSKYDSFAEEYITRAIEPVVKGEKDINTALREAEEQISKNIETNRQK